MVGRVPEDHVEVVEISAGCPNYDNTFHSKSLCGRFDLSELYNLVHRGDAWKCHRDQHQKFRGPKSLFRSKDWARLKESSSDSRPLEPLMLCFAIFQLMVGRLGTGKRSISKSQSRLRARSLAAIWRWDPWAIG